MQRPHACVVYAPVGVIYVANNEKKEKEKRKANLMSEEIDQKEPNISCNQLVVFEKKQNAKTFHLFVSLSFVSLNKTSKKKNWQIIVQAKAKR